MKRLLIKNIAFGIAFLLSIALLATGCQTQNKNDNISSGQTSAEITTSSEQTSVESAASPEQENTEKNDIDMNANALDFKSIKLVENNMTAIQTAYTAEKTENGVHLEYYDFTYYWDDELEDTAEAKTMIHEFDGDEAVYEQIAETLASADVVSWDGFSGSNPDVLDGYGFNFDAELSDGRTIYASGSNSFPDGYYAISMMLDTLCSRQEITEQQFDGGPYTITLPETWVGSATAAFREGYISFSLNEGTDYTLMALYNEPYYYGEGSEGYELLGTYEREGSTFYIVIKDLSYLNSRDYEKLSDTGKQIADQVETDIQDISDSFRLKEQQHSNKKYNTKQKYSFQGIVTENYTFYLQESMI